MTLYGKKINPEKAVSRTGQHLAEGVTLQNHAASSKKAKKQYGNGYHRPHINYSQLVGCNTECQLQANRRQQPYGHLFSTRN